MSAYGYCPICGEAGIRRERRINGFDTCSHGHYYHSSKAMNAPYAGTAPSGVVLDEIYADLAHLVPAKQDAWDGHAGDALSTFTPTFIPPISIGYDVGINDSTTLTIANIPSDLLKQITDLVAAYRRKS